MELVDGELRHNDPGMTLTWHHSQLDSFMADAVSCNLENLGYTRLCEELYAEHYPPEVFILYVLYYIIYIYYIICIVLYTTYHSKVEVCKDHLQCCVLDSVVHRTDICASFLMKPMHLD